MCSRLLAAGFRKIQRSMAMLGAGHHREAERMEEQDRRKTEDRRELADEDAELVVLEPHEYVAHAAERSRWRSRPHGASVGRAGVSRQPLVRLRLARRLRVLRRGCFGTFAPALRASDRPIAIACLRLVTFLPERPLRSVPRLRSRMTFATFFAAALPYLLAMCAPALQRCPPSTQHEACQNESAVIAAP